MDVRPDEELQTAERPQGAVEGIVEGAERKTARTLPEAAFTRSLPQSANTGKISENRRGFIKT